MFGVAHPSDCFEALLLLYCNLGLTLMDVIHFSLSAEIPEWLVAYARAPDSSQHDQLQVI